MALRKKPEQKLDVVNQEQRNAHEQRTKRGQHRPPRKPNFIQRAINDWFTRLVGAASDGTFSGQEEMYARGRTKRDYVWNTIGIGVWNVVFPLLTVVATQLVGVEQAGMFSMAFVVGALLMIVANYGVRTYQVSDIDEQHSFADYQVNRIITCVIMLFVGYLYCVFRGYAEDMFIISMGVYLYKMVDGLADVYEGRLQQVDKLYLAGISLTLRSVAVIVVFSLGLLITGSLAFACIAMAVASAIAFIIVTLPLTLFESAKSRRMSLPSVGELFKQCWPLFIALFLYTLVDSMPKFVMEGVLSYDNQLYFNALYFPAQGILVTTALIYKPQIVRMARLWADPSTRKKFDLFMLAVVGITVAFTLLMIVVMGSIGLPIMSFLYGVDFQQFQGLCFIMLVAGGVTALIEFLYLVVTVLRKQKAIIKLYLITFGFSLFIPVLLVNFTGLPGAVIGYLIIMSILLVLLVWEYLRIRQGLAQEVAAAVEEEPPLRPSERREIRERLKNHRGEGRSRK